MGAPHTHGPDLNVPVCVQYHGTHYNASGQSFGTAGPLYTPVRLYAALLEVSNSANVLTVAEDTGDTEGAVFQHIRDVLTSLAELAKSTL